MGFAISVDVHGGGVPAQLATILTKLEVLMAGVTEVNAAIDAQNGALATLGANLQEALARVAEDIQALKDQIAQGVDLADVVARIEGNTSKVSDVANALANLDPIPPVAG